MAPEVGNGVQQRFPLGCGTARDVQIDDIGREPFAAISKVVRVRVLFFEEQVEDILPCSSGTFFTSRSLIETKLAAVSSM